MVVLISGMASGRGGRGDDLRQAGRARAELIRADPLRQGVRRGPWAAGATVPGLVLSLVLISGRGGPWAERGRHGKRGRGR